MDDAIGLAEALLGLDGFRVLAVSETPDEVCITVETTTEFRARCFRNGPRLRGASTRARRAPRPCPLGSGPPSTHSPLAVPLTNHRPRRESMPASLN